MSQQLISRSEDLRRLREEGYDIEIKSGHLLVKSVPYVNSKGQLRRGTLVSPLGDVSGDVTHQPNGHTAFFIGEHPCNADGSVIQQIKHSSQKKPLGKGVVVDHMFSAKPKPDGRYRDYHHKMTTYVGHISGPARSVDPNVTAQTAQVVEPEDEDYPFHYYDSSPSRAGIGALTSKMEQRKIAIVGLGGTGSYVLDLVAKTPVAEIHLFDGDMFSNHNAFRSPGAPSLEDLRQKPLKVDYLAAQYSKMHRRVLPHDVYLDEENINALKEMDFVFLCMDRGSDKREAVRRLEQWGKSFIDVGMGVEILGEELRGSLRVTASTPGMRDHLQKRVPFSEGGGENGYSQNIQIAELNALNAALAVVKWKKLCGFYQDLEREHCSVYTINGNVIANEDLA